MNSRAYRRCRHAGVAAGAAACLLIGGAASGQVVQAGGTQLVSRPTGLGSIPTGLYNAAYTWKTRTVSADGRYVVFASDADGLSGEDNDRVTNVFRRDLQAGTTVLVSKATDGTPANRQCYLPVISADGMHVAYETAATNLDPAATNGFVQIYVRDIPSATTELASRADTPTGAAGNLRSTDASISDDGAKVAFTSQSTNLDSLGATGFNQQVYVRNLVTHLTDQISRADGGTGVAADASSDSPSISGDGTIVAFRTYATNLADDDTNSTPDIHFRNLVSNQTRLVSRASGATGAIGDSASASPSVDADGKRIAFQSASTNFDPAADTNGRSDIYMRDLTTLPAPTTTLVSRADGATGAVGNDVSQIPSISGDGSRIAFESRALNLGAPTQAPFFEPHLFVRDSSGATPTTRVVDRASGNTGAIADFGADAPSISSDGTKVVFISLATNLAPPTGDADYDVVYMRDLAAVPATTSDVSRIGPNNTPVTGYSWFTGNVVSADGRYVAFTSDSDNLSSENDDRWWGPYLRDTLTNTTVFLGAGLAGAAADNWAEVYGISFDGMKVAFLSAADNLVPGDTNGVEDCFVRDLTTGQTTLVSRAQSGALLGAPAVDCALSGDGSKAAFVTTSAAVPDDTNLGSDVYLRDLRANTTTLVSRADGGAIGTGQSRQPSLNVDGTKIAFASSSLLVPGATSFQSIYLRNVPAGTTELVSRGDGAGAPADNPSSSPAIDAAGGRVAFVSSGTNLVVGDTNARSDVFVRDLAAGTTTLVSRANSAGGAIGDDSSGAPHLSADGMVVSFESFAHNLTADARPALFDVFVRDLRANTTVLVSRGIDGSLLDVPTFTSALSANGHCVAYQTRGGAADPSVGPSDFSFIYLRTLTGECPNDPPDTTIASAPSGRTKSRTATFTLTSNDSTATFQCSLDGAAFAACGSTAALTGLADGAHTLTARAVDPVGNVDADPPSASWIVDGTPPTLTIIVPRQKLRTVLARGRLWFTARSSEGAILTVRLLRNGKTVGTVRRRIGTAKASVPIKLRLSKKTRKALRRARAARFVLTGSAADDLGNKRTFKRNVRLRR